MKHVIMYSGGIASWMTAKTVIDRHGPDDVVLLFADVKGDPANKFTGEDEDCYRFINETAKQFHAELIRVYDPQQRDIWKVFKDAKWIGNSRIAPCSHQLKQKPCRQWLNNNCSPADTTIYVGIDFSETHRLPAVRAAYNPYRVEAPLTEPPYIDKREMLRICRAERIQPPRMYAGGWPHANCQGGCVRAGQAQWRKLLSLHPDTYAYHENQEQQLRDQLGKNVAILDGGGG